MKRLFPPVLKVGGHEETQLLSRSFYSFVTLQYHPQPRCQHGHSTKCFALVQPNPKRVYLGVSLAILCGMVLPSEACRGIASWVSRFSSLSLSVRCTNTPAKTSCLWHQLYSPTLNHVLPSSIDEIPSCQRYSAATQH
ncbi:UNVERIFIED_CONTAM: hypothetical protein K2H54_039402 [Gekko kuhli]